MAIELTFDDIKQAAGATAQTAQAVRAVAEPQADSDGFIGILNRIENTLQLFNQIITNYQNLKENLSGNKENAAMRPNVNTFQFAPDRQPPIEAIPSKQVKREAETMPIEQMLKAKLVQFLKAYADLGFSEVTIENLYNEFKHLTVANLIDILDGKADVAKPDK